MPGTLTAFSVKIAASGQTGVKAAIAREVLYDWNSDRSWAEKKVFIPEASSEDCDATKQPPADLLVAFFCAPQKCTETIEAEIARQVQAGRPALVYFSEARSDFAGSGGTDFAQLKSRLPADAAIDSFKDEKEFRAKFTQKIEALVHYHPQFKTGSEISPASAPARPATPASSQPHVYSAKARELLISACDDPEAYVARMKDSRGLKIQVNGRQVVEPGNPEASAQWEAAFNELVHGGLIRDVGLNGQVFQISSAGFAFLETLGKKPVGYIAELGGM